MIVTVLLWCILGFLSGSLMFSLWLGRLALHRDIRQVGDGNPGTTNVFRAGGRRLGVLAFALDVLKGALPVALAKFALGIDGAGLAAVAIAPVLGHAFSPWVGFRGGKAVAVSFGMWIGLTLWEVPMLGGIGLGVSYLFIRNSGWALMADMLALGVYLAFIRPAEPVVLIVWAANIALFAFRYRADLRQPPSPRGWISRRLWPSTSPSA